MGRKIHKLTALQVTKANTPGARLSDGGNLYLRIGATGAKSWCFMYSMGGARDKRGRQREIGLGPLHTISLAEARGRAVDLRKLLLDGIDPMSQLQGERRDRARQEITFDEAAATYIEKHRPSWKNSKHAWQWETSLAMYASPVFGRFFVSQIDTLLILKCLEPIWQSKTETAVRVRGRLEKIFDWATTQKYRTGENPARWKGHLEHSLPAPGRIRKVEHFSALPYSEIGQFMESLRGIEGAAARMLEFLILTCCRSGEVRGATWGEVDFDAAVFTVPAERMKMKREHRVPLSKQALAILEAIKKQAGEVKPGDLIFPGPKPGKPYSDAAFSVQLRKRMGRTDITAHGFRSTFRDWAAECTAYPREVCEMALAHAIPDAVEAAYRRGDLLAKRAKLMDEWAAHCDIVRREAGNVTLINTAA